MKHNGFDFSNLPGSGFDTLFVTRDRCRNKRNQEDPDLLLTDAACIRALGCKSSTCYLGVNTTCFQ